MSKRMLFLMSITLLTLNTVNAFRGQGMLFLESDFKACGESDGDKDMFCALNSAQFNDCGKHIKIKGPKGNAIVKVKYECPTCSFGDLGLSPEVLSKIANPDDNEIPITWSFIGESDGFNHGHRNVPKVVPRAEEPAPEAPKDEPKETDEKEAPKDEPKETDEKEAPKDEPKTEEKEAPKDEPKTEEKEAPKEEPKESEEKEDPKDEPKEKEVKEAPKKEPKEKETPKEEPKETKEKTPKDTPKENEAPKKAPKEKETTKKAPKKAPIQNPKVIAKPKGIKVAQDKIGITPVKVKNNPKVSKGLGTGGKSAKLVDDNKSTLKFGKEKEKKANNVSTKFGAGDPNVFIANNASNHKKTTSTNDEDPNIDDDEDDDSRVIPATPTTTDQVLNENNNDQFQNEININKQLQPQNHQYSSNSMMKLELFSNKFTFITVLLAVTYLFD
ncbi:12895_t:CDS:2 [Funneliformis caledonium]|uniref:12895_t:CDS:1 n=1 Tax=Funneliformis caledonium TaxID=1117310 RepID=A0A9N9D8C7_9GLOM|nr:12895_t:CDS:2 [Funneliformis caledonium]